MNGKTVDSGILNLVITSILEEVHDLSRCESVAIRLQNEGDFPYYVHKDFNELFINKENSLNVMDEDGKIVSDDDGTPYVECMCGNILKKRVNPNFSFFTDKGSFWTNSTTRLLRDLTEEERKAIGRTRNTCHYFGYESVALIPIPIEEENLGLIQMNDPREDMFNLEMIQEYELIGDQIGKIIQKIREVNEQISSFFDLTSKIENSIE